MKIKITTNDTFDMELKLSTGYFTEKRLRINEGGDLKKIIVEKVKSDFLKDAENIEIKKKNFE